MSEIKRYISGPLPMRGYPDFNYPTFLEVEDALSRVFPDDEVLNPARNFGGDQTRTQEEYMTVDLAAVCAADEVVLLPGWQRSEGAQREIEVAKWTGKTFRQAAYSPAAGWHFRRLEEAPVLDEAPRASALDEARRLITGDRNNQYGPPTQDFERTAAMASAFGFKVNGEALKGHHVAIFMMLLKTSRLAWAPGKRDSWVDSAGYAGCGYECAASEAA